MVLHPLVQVLQPCWVLDSLGIDGHLQVHGNPQTLRVVNNLPNCHMYGTQPHTTAGHRCNTGSGRCLTHCIVFSDIPSLLAVNVVVHPVLRVLKRA